MRVFITSTPADLAPHWAAARDLGFEPSCARLGHRGGDADDPRARK